MSAAKKSKYLTKTTKFGGQTITLYSIDGLTWSTRPQELQTIMDRHANERILLDPAKEEDKDTDNDDEEKDKKEADLGDEEDDDLVGFEDLAAALSPIKKIIDEDLDLDDEADQAKALPQKTNKKLAALIKTKKPKLVKALSLVKKKPAAKVLPAKPIKKGAKPIAKKAKPVKKKKK